MRAFYSKTITFLWERFNKLLFLSNLCLYITTWYKGLSLETAPRTAADRAKWRSLVLPQAPDGSEEDWVTLLHSTKGLAMLMALAYSLCWSGSRWHVWCPCTFTLLHSTKGLVSWMALAYSLCWSGSRWHAWCPCTSCACTLLHSTKGLVQ